MNLKGRVTPNDYFIGAGIETSARRRGLFRVARSSPSINDQLLKSVISLTLAAHS